MSRRRTPRKPASSIAPDDGTPLGHLSDAELFAELAREKRSNVTHESTTDPEAKMATKGSGQAAKLSYAAHVLMENRNGLCTDVAPTPAGGTAEWDGALLSRCAHTVSPRTGGPPLSKCMPAPKWLIGLDTMRGVSGEGRAQRQRAMKEFRRLKQHQAKAVPPQR